MSYTKQQRLNDPNDLLTALFQADTPAGLFSQAKRHMAAPQYYLMVARVTGRDGITMDRQCHLFYREHAFSLAQTRDAIIDELPRVLHPEIF